MEILEAIKKIANIKSIVASGAKAALTNHDDLMIFVNQITDNYYESELNQTRLKQMFGDDVIESILDYSRKKAVEQDFIVSELCCKHEYEAKNDSNKKKLHMLLTDDVLSVIPPTTQITDNYGKLMVVFGSNINNTRTGKHCIVSDTEENLKNWLKNFDEIIVGCGTPMLESFTITKLKDINF